MKKPLALYVHWPFCKAKCPYCDFNSHVRDAISHEAWREALLAEMRHVARIMGPRAVTSVFFGGGTPSLMEAGTVQAILEQAQDLWGFAADPEITLEANPTSVEAGKFRDFRAAGINRVSIGVQSLVPEDLKALGRQHSVDDARAAVKLASEIFERYSFDLIYARPGQTPVQWERELHEAMTMAGDHLSVYQLTIEPGTQFHTLYNSGRLQLPTEDIAADFYTITQDVLGAAGMPAYEVSNHARPGQESRHNLTYWRYGEYAGIGPGAHGRIDVNGKRVATRTQTEARVRVATRTHRAPEEWLKRVQENGHGYHPFEDIDERAMFEERLMMGLRLREGVALEALNRDWLNAPKIATLMSEGLLEQSATHLIPTPAGRMVLTSLNGAVIAS